MERVHPASAISSGRMWKGKAEEMSLDTSKGEARYALQMRKDEDEVNLLALRHSKPRDQASVENVVA